MPTPNAAPDQPVPTTNGLQRHDTPGLSASLALLQEELQSLKTAVEHISESAQAAREASGVANAVIESASRLSGPVEGLIERIDGINFPSRLDKLDATVPTIGAQVQNLQARLESVERNIKDEVRRAQEKQEQLISAVGARVQGVEDVTKTLRIMLVVLLLLSVASVGLALFT